MSLPPKVQAPTGKHHAKDHCHGNPRDLAGYLAKMEEPARAAWQKPDEVVAALRIFSGQTVCDIGAGPGYFALRFAKAVGARGHVWAVDVEPLMVSALRERLQPTSVRNVTPVLALPDDPLIPEGTCDAIVIANTFHHFADGTAYLRRLVRSLRPGGRLVNIDFHKRELPVGPSLEHKISEEEFLESAQAAGLHVASRLELLPYQYFVILQPN